MWTHQVRLFRFSLEVLESDRTASVRSVTNGVSYTGRMPFIIACVNQLRWGAGKEEGGAREGVKKVP